MREENTSRKGLSILGPTTPFPDVKTALDEPNGLLAVGGGLSVQRLLDAYRHGIFPWYSEGQPVLWWSPDPRMVLHLSEFKVSRSLAKTVRRQRFEVRTDTAFSDVIRCCASARRSRQAGTWIGPDIVDSYIALHHKGWAHSVEAWDGTSLVGGLYGVLMGRVFFGESMFAKVTDASKVAFHSLIALLRVCGVVIVDCQQETAHLASFGARPIKRAEFSVLLAQLIGFDLQIPPACWPKGSVRVDV